MGKTPFSRFAAMLLLVFACLPAKATHIVGGVLNYRYTGSDNYEFTLYVYRDCKNGLAPFDDPAMIQVSLGDNTEYNEYFVNISTNSDTLSAHVDDPCVTVQPDVCVEFVKYIFTLNLPANPLGYIVSYSRCCRNNSILNLTRGSSGDGQNEIDWGATYTIKIPGGTQAIQNSSPVFKNFPPVGICANKPIIFDHSASDADGDSLVYRLCTPYDGATKFNPNNLSPFFVYQQPPYPNVLFQPPFGLPNLMGGIPLSIDPHTGLLTGTPTIIGQFVVGVCVDEYRNGQLLTTTIRDFQYNVTDCGLKVITSFFAPSVLCNTYTVNFTNQSSGASTYKWYFGDGDSSTLANPTHTYADTGHYKVTLISNPGQICFSTYSQVVSIQVKRVDAAFKVSDSLCLGRGDTIKFTDQSTDLFNINHWSWTFSTGKTDSSKNSYIVYDGNASSVTATLSVTSINGCSSTISKTISLGKKPAYTLPPSLSVCKGAKVQLPLSISGNNTFSWSPATGLNSTTLQNPTATVNGPIRYYVTIRSVSGNDTCVQRDSISLLVNDSITASISPKNPTLTCSGNSVLLSVSTNPLGGRPEWSNSSAFTTILDTNTTFLATVSGQSQTFYVRVSNNNGCSSIDSTTVSLGDSIPRINLADTLYVCRDSVHLTAAVPLNSVVTWSTHPDFIPPIGSGASIVVSQTLPLVKYYVRAQTGTCDGMDSVVVLYNDTLPDIQVQDSAFFCGNSVSGTAIVTNADSVIWASDPYFSTIISHQTGFNTQQTDLLHTYYIKAFFRFCSSTDSTIIRIQDKLPQISISDSVFVCADSVRLTGRITNYDSVMWSFDPNFSVIFSSNPGIVVNQTEAEKEYYVRVKYLQCEVTDSFRVFKNDTIPTVQIVPSPTLFCSDTVSASGSADYHTAYQWASDRDFTQLISQDTSFITIQAEAGKWYYFKASYHYCSAVDSILLENRSILYRANDLTVCQNRSLHIDLNIQTPANYETTWYIRQDTVKTNNSSTLDIQPDSTQLLHFRVENQYGCSVEDSLLITVNPTPNVIASVDKPEIYRGEQVQLNATFNSAYAYNWTPADQVSDPAIYNPTASPLQTTLFTVQVSNREQCVNTDTVSVRVLDYSCSFGMIFIPNAFTPNGDGINDVFRVRANILKSMHLIVYDRWGKEVFETNDINEGWDGNLKGQAAPADVYGYYFSGECLQGEKITLKGNVTLMR